MFEKKEPIIPNQIFKSNLQNKIYQTNSTKLNPEESNLQIIKVKSNPAWAELGPAQSHLVIVVSCQSIVNVLSSHSNVIVAWRVKQSEWNAHDGNFLQNINW